MLNAIYSVCDLNVIVLDLHEKTRRSFKVAKKAKKAAPAAKSTGSKDEQVGFHKGALSVLAKEREEMAKILNVVEQLMQMHIKALKELGVDLEAMAKQAEAAQQPAAQPQADEKPLEDALR